MAPEPVSFMEKVRFGEDFEVDSRAYELRRSGRALKLERIPMELLLLLVEQRDNLVTRDQIVERIWGSGFALDTNNSINGAIRKIRQVLRDNPERPRFVRTITGKGYRFIAPVIEPATGKALAFPPPQVPASEPEKDKRAYPRWPLLSGAAVILVAALLAYFEVSPSRVRPGPASGKRMLAVLPFENYTGDAGQEYFSDGLTDEVITQLGRLDPQRLGVTSRTSVMHYKNGRQPLDQVARELGVQYVLEGSVRRDSGTVRITAQLIQVRDQTHLWAQVYDRELKDLLVMQGEIARKIAGEIQLALGDNQKRAATAHSAALSRESYQAYDPYLKGRYFWNKRAPQGFQQAVECFEQAIAKDPNYARG
jgi:TolB-like protein/DNA-binding winged helix-turn-helix (wHTH) protein